ncbi:MAG TPA: hypothetical protein EYG46_04080 [Myxococcales bacterium]|nr:hypothetical protein [Myxococcales bacterium]HIM00160.1 hypothetical protein [Myxococcales bacterium]
MRRDAILVFVLIGFLLVGARLGVSEIYASVAAATLGFMAALVIASLLGLLLRGWDRARLGDDPAVGPIARR